MLCTATEEHVVPEWMKTNKEVRGEYAELIQWGWGEGGVGREEEEEEDIQPAKLLCHCMWQHNTGCEN